MRSAPRSLVWLSVALLVAVLGAAVLFLAQEPPPLQVVRLPDGADLRLEAVSFGERHRFSGGRRWERLVGNLVPSWRRSSRQEIDPASRQTSPGTLLFWTSRPNPSWSPERARFIIVDEHGCEFDRGVPWQVSVGKREVEAWAAGRFPRRGRQVTLRIYSKSSAPAAPPLAEFTIPNPDPGPHPVWPSEALPISRRDGELTLTLAALRTGLTEKGPVEPPWWRMGGPWSCATLKLTQDHRPAPDWQIRGVTFTDATGNPSAASYSVRGAKGEWHFVCGGSLAPHETAWKLRVEYLRSVRFPPADLWTVKRITVPERRAVTSAPVSITRHGATLHLLGITGPTASPLPEPPLPEPPAEASPSGSSPFRIVRAPSNRWTVNVQGSLPGGGSWWEQGVHVSLLNAIDDRGQKATISGGSIDYDGRHRFELQIRPGAKRLDLTFAVVKSRFVEFVVKPTRVR